MADPFPYTVKTIREADSFDVERWLEKYYGLAEVSLVADNEWHNDSTYTISIEPEMLTADERERCWLILNGTELRWQEVPRSSTLLDYAAMRGDIEPGRYYISVMW